MAEVTACAQIFGDSPGRARPALRPGDAHHPVDVGGPFTTARYDSAPDSLVRAPGAWVAWSGERPAKGADSVIVGLR